MSDTNALSKGKIIDLATAMVPTVKDAIKDVTADNDMGQAAYIASLPEGIDSTQAAAVHRHDSVFTAASGVASQEAAVKFMKSKDGKEADEVSFQFDMLGGHNVTHVVKRSVERHEMKDGDGKVIAPASTAYGVTTSRMSVPVSGAKQLLKQGQEAAAKVLSK